MAGESEKWDLLKNNFAKITILATFPQIFVEIYMEYHCSKTRGI